MAFMDQDIEFGLWYVVDHDHTDFVQQSWVGDLGVPLNETVTEDTPGWDQPDEDSEGQSRWEVMVGRLSDYLDTPRPRERVQSVELREGYGARLSASGYMDSTDWSLFDTLEEAEDYLDEQHDLGADEDDNREYYQRRLQRLNRRLARAGCPVEGDEDEPATISIMADWMEENGYGQLEVMEVRDIAEFFGMATGGTEEEEEEEKNLVRSVKKSITRDEAIELGNTRGILYHTTLRNRDGTALRVRVNGRCQTWVTRPDHFRLPCKYGLREGVQVTQDNADEWLTYDPTEFDRLARSFGLSEGTPLEILHDRLLDAGRDADALRVAQVMARRRT